MISTSLPDPENAHRYSNLSEKHTNSIITATVHSNYFCPEHEGSLGLLCNYGGEANYLITRRKYIVSDNSFIILNHGSQITIDIKPQKPLECFYIFFRHDLPQQVLTGLLNSHEHLLDNPDINSTFHFNFIERLYDYDNSAQPNFFKIRKYITSIAQPDENRIDEILSFLLQDLLHLNINTYKETSNLKVVKKSTRVEIYQRLYYAKEYLDNNYSDSLSLRTIAQEANFHPHHFLRLFKQLFQLTPHQYLTQKRLEQAKRLLLITKQPISEICFNVGFHSISSFSGLFRAIFTLSPLQFRNSYS